MLLKKLKILLLEYSSTDAELILRELAATQISFDSLIVDCKAEYIKALDKFSPDIILSDYLLPTLTSLEALQLAVQKLDKIPFIIVSGTMSAEFAVEIMKAGASDCVPKSKLQNLSSAIIDSIEKYRIIEEQDTAYERLKFHLENTPLGYIEWDNQMQIKSMSKRTEQIFGWSIDELLAKEQTDYSHVYEEDLSIVTLGAKDLITGITQRNTVKNRNVTKDGNVIWCEWFNSVLKNKEGKIVTLVSLVQDISESKHAEQKLISTNTSYEQALNALKKVMDSSLDVICSIDEHGRFVGLSSASERIWGYKPDELIGKEYMDFVYDHDKESTVIVAAQITSGTPVTMFENRYMHKNGNIVPMLWSARWDDQDKLMYCIAKDATEKKRLEKAFESERSRIDELFLQAPSCMGILKGPRHVFEKVNPLYLQLIGRKHIIGKPVKEILPEIADQGFIKILDEVYRTGETFSANEMFIKLDKYGNGELVEMYLNFIYQAYRNPEGDIDGIFFFAIDVSEQVKSRRIIEESEKQYRQIVETAEEGIWMLDKNDCTTFVNSKLCEILGYDASEMMGRENTFFMDDEGKEIASGASIGRILGRAEKVNISLITKAGKKIWVTLSGSTILGPNGEYNGGLSMVTDITESKIIAEKFALEQSRLNEAQAIAHLGNWGHNFATEEGLWSAETCRIFGLNPEKNMHTYQDWLSFIHPEDMDYVLDANRESQKTFSDTILEHRIILKDGSIKHIHTESKFEFDKNGSPVGLYGISHDITERKISEEKLRKSESQLKEAQGIAHLGNWDVNLSDDTTVWSDGLYKIFGVDNEVTPSKAYFLTFIHPDDFDYANEKIKQAFTTLENSYFDFRFIRKDGASRYGYCEWKFEFDKNRNPFRLFGIIQDITERKMAEMERIKIFNDLMLRNKDLEQFAYIVSHNLRAPVANILGASNGLKEPGLSQGDKNMLKAAIYDSVLGLDNVVKDLNNILQVKGEINETKEKVSFSELVEDIKITVKNLLDKNNIKIHYCFLEIDEFFTLKNYLYSIFYNLIYNSIKYRQHQLPCVIEIKSYRKQNKLQLCFSDNGMGIDLQKKGGQVFGLYKRFHPGIEGKGMGLFMVKTQVESLGGKIGIKSAVNEGTEFKIEFEI